MKEMLKKLVVISRPRFWLYEFGTFAIGVLAGAMMQEELFNPIVLVYGLFFLFPANLLIYGINDIFDYDTDILNPKKTGYEKVLPKESHHDIYRAILVTNLPFVVLATILPFEAAMALAAFFLFATFYSALPIRAKVRPVLDSFFSAGHYIATGVFGYYLVGGEGNIWWLVFGAMAWAMAMHAYSAVPDIEADSQAGFSTIATKLGQVNTILLCLAFYSFAMLVGVYYLGPLVVILYLPYLIMMVRSLGADDQKLMTLYTYFPTINSTVGMLLFFLILIDKGWL